jgi:hypothetical protein
MNLSYVLHTNGWATATISAAHQSREMTVSYLSDSLSDMAQAAIRLLEGADSVRFSFDDEPGEHRCVATRTCGFDVEIRVLWFRELWSGLPDERGSEVFTCRCTIARFCGEVLACLQRLLDEHGIKGYKERWDAHDFPLDKLERLQTLVSERGGE